MPRISCPFCNSSFEPSPAGRVACPRCGEAVPVRGREGADLPAVAVAPPPPGPPRRPVLPVVLVVAVLVAAGAGYYALRKPVPTPAPPEPAGTVVAPAALRGLTYLPSDANVVFAVQPGPVLDYAARTNQSPTDLLTGAGVPASALAALGRGGVTLQGIDHIAGGVTVPDEDLGQLRLAVALVLRQPVPDEAKFLDALKARPAKGAPARYEADFANLPVKLARVTDRVWLVGWSDPDVAPAGNGLSDRVRATLTETLPPNAAIWLMTDSADWGAKKSVGLLLTTGGKADWQPGLARVRAVAAGLTLTDGPTLRVMARGATPAARELLRESFRQQGGTAGEAGDWDYLDTPADRAGGLAALRAVLAPPK